MVQADGGNHHALAHAFVGLGKQAGKVYFRSELHDSLHELCQRILWDRLNVETRAILTEAVVAASAAADVGRLRY